MSKLPFLLLAGILSLLASACRTGGVSPVYDVVVVAGGPAGIGAALAAAETGARTALLERDGRIGGTTVQAEVCDMGLFYAWRHPIIAGPGWEMVQRAVAEAGGTLPDFSKQEPDKWMESCVHVDPVVYARVAPRPPGHSHRPDKKAADRHRAYCPTAVGGTFTVSRPQSWGNGR